MTAVLDTTSLRPTLSPAPDASAFWEAAARHVLVLPHCDTCDAPFFYPRIVCPSCGTRELTWVEASGDGTLHSFCVHFHSSEEGLSAAVPFATALVDLEEGPRLMTFLVGVPEDPEQIRCGVPGRIEYVDVDGGHTVLAFRPS